MKEEMIPSQENGSDNREIFKYTGLRLVPEGGPCTHHVPGRRGLVATTAMTMPIIMLELAVMGLVLALSMGHMTAMLTGLAGLALALIVVRLRNGRLVVDEEGIAFPDISMAAARGKLRRPWQDLTSIDVDTQKAPYGVATHTKVLFQFKDGSIVPLCLLRLAEEDVHSFRNALVRWSPVKNPRINDMSAVYENERDNCFEFSRAQFSALNRNFALGAYERARESDEIGSYQVLKTLAAGHTSALYLAAAGGKQVRLREFVLPDECSDKEKLMQQLLATADKLRSIDHENICAVADAFEHAGRFYYALEEKGGSTLCQVLDYDILTHKNPLPNPTRVALAMAQLVAALHLYEPYPLHGLIHPGAFRLSREKSVYLCDFGFAQNLITQASGVFYGDMSYAAPEQLNGIATSGSDIYGLGATIFYLFTRKDPLPLCPSTLLAHGSKVGPLLDSLISQCTAYSAPDRPATVASIAQQLQSIAADEGKVPIRGSCSL